MIESSKVVFFSFFVIKSELGRWGIGGTIFAKPFFFVVDVVGCIHFRNFRNFLFYFLFMPGTPVGPRGVTGLA